MSGGTGAAVARSVKKPRARKRSGRSKRLDKLRLDVRGLNVEAVDTAGLASGKAAGEALAAELHEAGDYGTPLRFRAVQAYNAARLAGASHELACDAAAKHIGKTATYAADLIQEARSESAEEIVLQFDILRHRGLTLDETLVKLAQWHGFGADAKGRLRGRGLEDLKRLLTDHGRDVSASKLKARR